MISVTLSAKDDIARRRLHRILSSEWNLPTMTRRDIKMAKTRIASLSEETAPFQRWRDLPHIPATDNEPGAPELLLKANRILRGRRWPAPYDRMRQQMILGDARDLRT